MYFAYVLINTETGKENEVVEKISELEETREVCVTYGTFDIVVKLEASDSERLRYVILRKIRNMEGVRSTITLIGTKPLCKVKNEGSRSS